MIPMAEGNERTHAQLSPRELLAKISAKFLITPENIPHLAYPIVQFIHEKEPDYILVCDRGARVIGFAVYMLYKELYGDLPTKDQKVHIRKVSRKDPPEKLREQFRNDIQHMVNSTKSSRILVLDDWVLTGRTKSLITGLVSEFSEGHASTYFGVMRGRGKGADVSGDRHSPIAYYAWRNRDDLIGVGYDSEMKPHGLGSQNAIDYRKRIVENVRVFARNRKML